MIVLLLGCGEQVVEVYDGDTFLLANGEKVRLLGINAPEIGEPGSDIARDYLENLLLHHRVRLVREDVDRDKYGRLLRYVYLGNRFINEEMVARGYAESYFLDENDRLKPRFDSIEIVACKNRRGLWAFNVYQPPVTVDEKFRIIHWREAEKYYYQNVTVEGKIVRTHRTKRVCFLNFDPDYRHTLTGVIFASDLSKFPKDPQKFYLNKKVRITGLIKQYKGAPEIIIKDPAQIEIIR